MVSISPNITPKVVSFKGEEGNKAPQQHREVPKTHAGVYTGAVMGGIGSLGILMQSASQKVLSEQGIEVAKTLNKWAAIPLAFAFNMGCGALIDHFINKKNEEFTEATAGMEPTQATATDERAELTAKGNAYRNSNIGMKYGALIGLIGNPIYGAINTKGKGITALTVILGALSGALGGCALGAITDHFANKNAEKVADKNAKINANV